MRHTATWRESIEAGLCNPVFRYLYPGQENAQRTRYLDLLFSFESRFGAGEAAFFSAPGRTEIGGNHTDHQGGQVLAAAISLDALAVVRPNDDEQITILSQGYGELCISLSDMSFKTEEKNTTAALVRGVAGRLHQLGYPTGGFDAVVSSQVLPGSGLSSSAAFEVLIGTILSALYCDGTISPVLLAQIGQYAENFHFGKPCGLMDQCASSVGGFCAIDFNNAEHPDVVPISCNPADYGYAICLVDAGGSHADLTHEYAAIPQEMGAVAKALGGQILSEIPREVFYRTLPLLRGKVSDRALLRAMHFYDEDAVAGGEAQALQDGDFDSFLRLVERSGRSSQERLQNIYPAGDITERSVSLALALCRRLLEGKGAWRVHGGGFAGTVLAFVPTTELDRFTSDMEQVFGAHAVHHLTIRPVGGISIESLL